MQHLLRMRARLLVPAVRLEFPRQELPVELARSPEQAVLEAARLRVDVDAVRGHSAGMRHARREDAAPEAGVQDGHGAHDAGLVGEVDVQVDTEVAARGDVIPLVVLLFDVGEGAVAEERAVEQGRVGAAMAEALLRNHGDGALHGVGHDVAGARGRLCGARRGPPAAVAGYGDDLGRLLGPVHHHDAERLA